MQSGWILAERFLRSIFGLVVGIWVIRHLGPAEFGLWSYVASLIGIASPLIDLGLRDLVLRDFAIPGANRAIILGTALSVRAIAAIFASVVAGLIIFYSGIDSLGVSIAVFLITSMFFSPLDVFEWAFLATSENKKIALVKIASLAVIGVSRIWLLVIEAPLLSFVFLLLFEVALTSIAIAVCFIFKRSMKVGFSSILARSLLIQGFPLLASALLVSLSERIGPLLLQFFWGVKDVGVYSAALRFSEFWYFVPLAIVSAAQPLAVKAAAVSQERLDVEQWRIFRMVHIICAAICIPLSLGSPWIVSLFLGPAYSDSGLVISIHVFSGWLIALGCARSITLIIRGDLYFLTCSMGMGFISVMGAGFLLIPTYGTTGAAMAAVIGNFSAVFGACFLVPRYRLLAKMMLSAFLPWSRRPYREPG